MVSYINHIIIMTWYAVTDTIQPTNHKFCPLHLWLFVSYESTILPHLIRTDVLLGLVPFEPPTDIPGMWNESERQYSTAQYQQDEEVGSID